MIKVISIITLVFTLYFCEKGTYIVFSPYEGDTISVYLNKDIYSYEITDNVYSVPSKISNNETYYVLQYSIGYWSERQILYLSEKIDSITYKGKDNWKLSERVDITNYLKYGLGDTLNGNVVIENSVLTLKNRIKN